MLKGQNWCRSSFSLTMAHLGTTFPTPREVRQVYKGAVEKARAENKLQPLARKPSKVGLIVPNAGIRDMPGRETIYVSNDGQRIYLRRIQGGDTSWFSAGRSPFF